MLCPFQVDGSIRKLLKGGRDLDDSLVAVVIQNLKIVKVFSLATRNRVFCTE